MTALVWCTFPDRDSAERMARQLLDERLIVCANIMDGITSVFVWQGASDTSGECGALFKTAGELLEAAVDRIAALHPYQTPAVMGWHCQAAPHQTREWIEGALGRARAE